MFFSFIGTYSVERERRASVFQAKDTNTVYYRTFYVNGSGWNRWSSVTLTLCRWRGQSWLTFSFKPDRDREGWRKKAWGDEESHRHRNKVFTLRAAVWSQWEFCSQTAVTLPQFDGLSLIVFQLREQRTVQTDRFSKYSRLSKQNHLWYGLKSFSLIKFH